MALKKVYLELTSSCNLNCEMCYRKNWNEEDSAMDSDILNKAIEEINENESISDVVLGGIGEPCYSKNIVDVLYKLKNKNLILTTNGTIVNDNLVQAIVDCVNQLVISVDGMHKTFSKIRHTSLDNIINNVKKINIEKKKQKNTQLKTLFQVVLSKQNVGEVFDILDLAISLDVSEIILSNLQPTTMEEYEQVLYKRYENDEYKSFFKKVYVYASKHGVKVRFPAYQLKTERRCRFIDNNTTMINFHGAIVPCYRLSHNCKEVVFGREKDVLSHSFGNVKDNKISELWESNRYKRFRSVVYNNHYPSCIDCDWVDGCDYVSSTSSDCYGNQPSCSDCLWSRDFTFCI